MGPLKLKDLLLAARLERQQVEALLSPYGFTDPLKADANLQAMAAEPAERELLAEIVEELFKCVSLAADPDQALTYLERFAAAAIHKLRLFTHLKDSPRALEILTKTLGGSPYMAEILIRDPQHFYWVSDPQVLHSARNARSIKAELLHTLKLLEDEEKQLDYLRFFKRRQMLHIGVRDLLRVCSVEETLAALSVAADALITAAYWISARQHETAASAFTILAMGKLGGGELNFSSDVDLMYVYQSDDLDHLRGLALKVTAALNDFTAEGYVYRVDLRLRPEGRAGYIADSLAGYERYYKTRLSNWERLALLKARPVAGNRGLGRRFLDMIHPFVYEMPFDSRSLEEIRGMRSKMDEQMSLRQQRDRNVKLGTGGIREIELIAQCLQIRHGGLLPRLRVRNTLKALEALRHESLLSEEDCANLKTAYVFLRDVENKLQMVNDAQTHSLPRDHQELTTCARLIGYSEAEPFLRDYQRHTGQVHLIFERRFSESN
jgi:[glutamine synthetase] adenylyltransferase / [glutamine synthetase]-adenylyl-L-tyrosine phosphorylase